MVLLAVLLVWAAPAAAGDPSVAVFASERIFADWVGSSFSAIPGGEAQANECESAVGARFREGGYAVAAAPWSEAQQRDARQQHAVFSRYADVSAMPNDIAIRAAGVVAAGAVAVVACGVAAEKPKAKAGQGPGVCASASCKVVDMKLKRRVAAAAGRACVERAEGTVGGIAAIRNVCREIGGMLVQKLAGRYR